MGVVGNEGAERMERFAIDCVALRGEAGIGCPITASNRQNREFHGIKGCGERRDRLRLRK